MGHGHGFKRAERRRRKREGKPEGSVEAKRLRALSSRPTLQMHNVVAYGNGGAGFVFNNVRVAGHGIRSINNPTGVIATDSAIDADIEIS